MKKQSNVLLDSEDHELLMKEAYKRQLDRGAKYTLSDLVREQLEPLLNSLRNGSNPPTEQTSEPVNEQKPTGDKDSFDFGDLSL